MRRNHPFNLPFEVMLAVLVVVPTSVKVDELGRYPRRGQ